MLYSGDEKRHNNPQLAYVDTDFVRGGGRVVADEAAMYALRASIDQLKQNVTNVYVQSSKLYYTLVDIANVDNASGWSADLFRGGLSTWQAYYGGNALVTKGPYYWTVYDTQSTNWAYMNPNHPAGYRFEVYADTLLTLASFDANSLPDNNIPGRQITRGVRPGLFFLNSTSKRITWWSGNNFKELAHTDDFTNKVVFYTIQTASFNLIAAMASQTIRCNHATAPIVATLNDDSQFTVGDSFILWQSNDAPVGITGTGITFNAPQGMATSRKYSYLQVIKQAVGIYSVTLMGDDPTKASIAGTNFTGNVQKNGVSLATVNDVPEKAFTLNFFPPNKEYRDYFKVTRQVSAITLVEGVQSLQYSLNGGSTYVNPTLPLQAPINIPAGTTVRWRVNYINNAAVGVVYIELN